MSLNKRLINVGGAIVREPYPIEYLVVAGGGGSYYSGGGGGGYRTNVVGSISGGNSAPEAQFTSVLDNVYTITVGGGGPSGHTLTPGGDSSFDSIVSKGGGAASNLWGGNGGNGGSGGGSNVECCYGPDYKSGGAGTAGQGYRGGNASTTGASDVTCGGGGAGGPGGDKYGRFGEWEGSPGGSGLVSSIDGLGIVRSAGGYGGVADPPQPHGAGSGGQSAVEVGKTGVVILRVPTLMYSGIVSGNPVITTIADKTIITFNGSGTYTG
jgi:hypothetical protein